jgi:hemin uptake protein HemP
MDKTVYRTPATADPTARTASAPEAADGAEARRLRRLESASLFQRGREVVIVHHGQEYRLRITKSDKLILTK